MLVKYKGHIIDCYLNKDLLCFSVYPDKESGELIARYSGAIIPGVRSVPGYVEKLKQDIDNDFAVPQPDQF